VIQKFAETGPDGLRRAAFVWFKNSQRWTGRLAPCRFCVIQKFAETGPDGLRRAAFVWFKNSQRWTGRLAPCRFCVIQKFAEAGPDGLRRAAFVWFKNSQRRDRTACAVPLLCDSKIRRDGTGRLAPCRFCVIQKFAEAGPDGLRRAAFV
jgi:hypothetical protein